VGCLMGSYVWFNNMLSFGRVRLTAMLKNDGEMVCITMSSKLGEVLHRLSMYDILYINYIERRE